MGDLGADIGNTATKIDSPLTELPFLPSVQPLTDDPQGLATADMAGKGSSIAGRIEAANKVIEPIVLRKQTQELKVNPEEAQRNRKLAVEQAKRIQYAKEFEMTKLESIERLIDFPLRGQDPDHPDATDIQQLKAHISLFNESDFDSAVEERNVNTKCGYFLCQKAPGWRPMSARFGGARNERAPLKQRSWCSSTCAEKTLYLIVQIRDTSLGERMSKNGGNLKLLGEQKAQEARHPVDQELSGKLDQLAIERGDGADSILSRSVMKGVQEKRTSTATAPMAPRVIEGIETHQQVEGYTPAAGGQWTMRLPMRDSRINREGDILDSI